MEKENENIFSCISSEMNEPSKARRHFGVILIQIGLAVIFFADSEEVGLLGQTMIALAWFGYVVGLVFFYSGCGKRFFEDRKTLVLSLTVTIVLTVVLFLSVTVTESFKGLPHDAKICIFFIAQIVTFTLTWAGEEI